MHRNFEWRVSPQGGQRSARCYVEAATFIGAPVVLTEPAEDDGLGRNKYELATGATAPVPGKAGICIYEFKGDDGWAGDDPYLATTSDKTTAPAGAAVQVVSGSTVKVAFRNTETANFLGSRSYEGVTVVAGIANLEVGDYLVPGAGTDADGYWAVASPGGGDDPADEPWMVVTGVDSARGEVEARLLF